MADSRMAVVAGLRMHYLVEGAGPLIVLLHGWPQTSYCWRHIIGPLAVDHTVVAPDLRGYGQTDKPRAPGYDKRTMAEDIRGLVHHLGFDRLTLVGHDRGARVAHRYALEHPEEVERLVVMDIVPTREMWRRFNIQLARGLWHWMFHLQPDLPERLVGNDIRGYLEYFFERWTVNRPRVEEGVDEYVRAYSRPGALRAGFDDYRASFPEDAEADDASWEEGRRLTMPVLALWGMAGLPASVPVLDVWRDYAEDVTGAELPCGHFLAEEEPELVVEHLRKFLAGG